MPEREDEVFYKVFDAESESCDWSDEWSVASGREIRVGRPNKARLLEIRKRLAAWGREHFAPFADYLRDDLQLSESSVRQTISRLTVATYETNNRPWMKLRDPLISWSYTALLHSDLRKLAAWVLLDPDELSDQTRDWVEEMVEDLLADGHWNGGSRFQLLERYSVKPRPRKREVVRAAPGAAPEPEEEAETQPARKPTRKRPRASLPPPRPEPGPTREPTDPAPLPEVLLIDEVASLFRLGRNTAYQKFHVGELPGGRKIGRRLIRFSRDAVLKHLGLPSPEPDAEINNVDVIDVKGLAALLRTSRNTIYEQLGNGDLVLPDDAVVSKRPRRFSRRAVLLWLGRGNGCVSREDGGSS